jgi:hypothetical protein
VSPVLHPCGRGRRTRNEAPRPCRRSRRSSPRNNRDRTRCRNQLDAGKLERARTARTVDGHHRRPPWDVATPSRFSPRAISPRLPPFARSLPSQPPPPIPLRVTSEKKERRPSRRETAYVIGRGKAILWRSGRLFKGQRGAEILSTGGWLTSINSAVGLPLQVTEGPAGAGPAAYFLP